MDTSVIIIGGGLAGLTAARQLHQKGIDFIILEASARIGGRVKTDTIDGFRLDHGFQVLLTAYPQTQKWLDYAQLDLKQFQPGAMLLYPDGNRDRIGDPMRDFGSLFPTLFSQAGSLKDKLLILKLRNRLAKMTVNEIFQQEEISTREALSERYGFSAKMIERFFGPFFAGIFLEKKLYTSRRMFDFVFKMFSAGDTAVPNSGMEAIPKALASPLPRKNIRTRSEVVKIERQVVHMKGGKTLGAPQIILATEATGIIKQYSKVKTRHQQTTHLHYVASEAPIEKPVIALNTVKRDLVNNVCTISKVAPGYSPDQRSLVSVSVVGRKRISHKELEKAVRKELGKWFGNATEEWRHLHTRRVVYALPDQANVSHAVSGNSLRIRDGLHVCGDHLLNGSINAAMKSGAVVGASVAEEF